LKSFGKGTPRARIGRELGAAFRDEGVVVVHEALREPKIVGGRLATLESGAGSR
jgi:hypothetical protein